MIFTEKIVDITCISRGKKVKESIRAVVVGQLAVHDLVHPDFDYGYVITHIKTGLRVSRRSWTHQHVAVNLCVRLNELFDIDYIAETKDEIGKNKLIAYISNAELHVSCFETPKAYYPDDNGRVVSLP